MEKIDIYTYYMFGYNYNNLGRPNNETNIALFKRYEEYLNFVTRLALPVTLSAIKLKGLENDIETLKKLSKSKATRDKLVDNALHDKMLEKIVLIDNVLDAELSIKIAYVLEEKRYSIEILTTKIGKLFNDSYFIQLPLLAQHDFSESGMCLAFDRYTACAFHALRATEDTLKWYYSLLLTAQPTDTDTWGTFEVAIQNAIKKNKIIPPPSEHLLINISGLRKYYRNKTQHPQLTYTSDDAQDLLSLCTKCVNEMVTDLKKRKLL